MISDLHFVLFATLKVYNCMCHQIDNEDLQSKHFYYA